MGIRTIDEARCDGCGICVEVCPQDVIKMAPSQNLAFVKYLRDCQSCYLCEADCPQEAIYVSPDRERRIPMAW